MDDRKHDAAYHDGSYHDEDETFELRDAAGSAYPLSDVERIDSELAPLHVRYAAMVWLAGEEKKRADRWRYTAIVTALFLVGTWVYAVKLLW